jgi:hypothetical protein
MGDDVLWRRLVAELLGSAFLAAIVIGLGIAAQQLSPGNSGLELFENAAATATGLFAIVLMFGPISGAQFNPVVSFVDAAFGGLRWRYAVAYLPAQVAGCVGGAVMAPDVQAGGHQHLDQAPSIRRPLPLRDRGHPRPAACHLRPGPHRPKPVRSGGCWGLHRRRLLLHQLDQLRQSPASPSGACSPIPLPGSPLRRH